MIITLDLSDEEVARLEIAMYFQDKGPVPEGWQSPPMAAMREKVERAVSLAKDVARKVE